ncbi:DUF5034 domain-containing protein [Porphyromonas loveana]|uniref:DUF5034 domain-containing protein n=1 Tax=Porphyromonas loveana TaxID=1884669 RepID=UPI00359FA87C
MKIYFKPTAFAVFLYVLLGALSCGQEPGATYRKNFVNIYISPDYLSEPSYNQESGKYYFEIYGKYIQYNTPEQQALSEKYGDTNFNGFAHIFEAALAQPLASVDVVAIDDYDEEHPAGSSLNDITIFTYYTYQPFISGGYHGDESITKVELHLSDMPTEPLILLKENFQFYLEQAPSTSGEHKVQVTFTFEDGKQISQTLILSANQENK